MKFNIIFGGKAGQGPNILTEIVSECLIEKGYYVFYSREYESLIRGGHNYNILTFSDEPVFSNESKIDILVCLDEKTKEIHSKNLKDEGIVIYEERGNMYFAGSLMRIFGIEFHILEEALKKIKNFEQNFREAKDGYDKETRKLGIGKAKNNFEKARLINGNQGISKGAIDSGLEYYYGYPMTPATPVMMELGMMQLNSEMKHKVIELENEISVMIAGLGSAMTGARVMVGSSGGGYDLMTEGLSLAGMAEVPIVVYLSSRPGPSTGLATYTSQGDLNLALHSGHGEFNRIVVAPGDALECIEVINQAFYLSQKFRTPAIVLGDKHLAEAKFLVTNKERLVEVKKSITKMERFNSYEHDENGNAIEDSKTTIKNFDRRRRIAKEIAKESQKFEMFKIYGNKNSKNLILGFGSTKGAILDAIKDGKIDAKFIQVLYLEPFSDKIKAEIEKAKKVLFVENNATAQLARLVSEKTGLIFGDESKILKYDGRAFFSDELLEEVKRR